MSVPEPKQPPSDDGMRGDRIEDFPIDFDTKTDMPNR